MPCPFRFPQLVVGCDLFVCFPDVTVIKANGGSSDQSSAMPNDGTHLARKENFPASPL